MQQGIQALKHQYQQVFQIPKPVLLLIKLPHPHLNVHDDRHPLDIW